MTRGPQTRADTLSERDWMTGEAASSHDLERFALSDMIVCGAALRGIGGGAETMEEVANRIVHYLHDRLRDTAGERSCALVRFFKTEPFEALDQDLRSAALDTLHTLDDGPPRPDMRCLALLATAGERPEWNSRHESATHKVIPLPSQAVVSRIPMVSQLIQQFGLPLNALVEPHPELLSDLGQKKYNVFHVAEAVGSPYIPAQEDFVVPYGIRSVLGFGGMLPSGDLFALILFSRSPIPEGTADFFQTIALDVKLAILPFGDDQVFARG